MTFSCDKANKRCLGRVKTNKRRLHISLSHLCLSCENRTLERQRALDNGSDHCRGCCLCYFVFFFDGCAALEVYLDAVIIDYDLFDQLFYDRFVVRIRYSPYSLLSHITTCLKLPFNKCSRSTFIILAAEIKRAEIKRFLYRGFGGYLQIVYVARDCCLSTNPHASAISM